MTDTVFQSISYIRPGRTRDALGAILPTHMRYTYNLNVPLAAMIAHCPEREPGMERNDAENEAVVDALLKNGATYIDGRDTFIPGYVVTDTTTDTSTHWQFFHDNAMAFYVHKMTNEKGDTHILAKEAQKPYRQLNENEKDLVIALMAATKDGAVPLCAFTAPLDPHSALVL